MTVDPNSTDLPAFVAEHLARAEPDLFRNMLSMFGQALMSAEADAICGAPYGERSPDRITSRNGYRTRDFDTRTGTMEVAIPTLREGSYFPDWFLDFVVFASFAGPTGQGYFETAGSSAIWSPDGLALSRIGREVGDLASATLF